MNSKKLQWNIIIQKVIGDLEIIDCYIDILNKIDNYTEKELIYTFHIVKEFELSPTSSLNSFDDSIRQLLSKKDMFRNEIIEFLNDFITKKSLYQISLDEVLEPFERFQQILGTRNLSGSSRVDFIIEKFHGVKCHRKGMRYAIAFFGNIFKYRVFSGIHYLDSNVLSLDKFKHTTNYLAKKAANKAFNPTSKLNNSSISQIISKLIEKNLINKKQSVVFEQILLGINIYNKILWLKDVSTLYYFIKLMHKNKFFVDYSATKWKITSNLFMIESGKEIEFRKLRGLKPSKSCVLIDCLFKELSV